MIIRGGFNLIFIFALVFAPNDIKSSLPEWGWALVAFLFYFILEDCVLLIFLWLICIHLTEKRPISCNFYIVNGEASDSSFSVSKVFNVGSGKETLI